MANDSFYNKARQIFAPRMARLSANWSECKNVLWNTRNVAYILCLMSIVLLVSLILSWNKNFIIFLTGAMNMFAVYGALVVSKQSCFSVFDSAFEGETNSSDNDVSAVTSEASCPR